jgi:hypothetical protein
MPDHDAIPATSANAMPPRTSGAPALGICTDMKLGLSVGGSIEAKPRWVAVGGCGK